MGFNLNFDWIKGAAASAVTFSKKNAPAIMTGGGILMFWGSLYMFWQESKKAEKKIAYEEIKLQSLVNVEEGEDPVKVMKERSELPKKEKAVIYLEYCWLSLLMGLGATGLLILAQKISIDKLVAMYATTQFLEKKIDDKDTTISKLKEKAGIKDGSKAEDDMRQEILKEQYPKERVEAMRAKATGSGNTLVIDNVTGGSFYKNIIDLTDGIAAAGKLLDEDLEKQENKCRRTKKKNELLEDPFFSKKDNVWEILEEKTNDVNLYGTLDIETFMKCVGERADSRKRPCQLGELLEFRKYVSYDTKGNKIDTNPIKISRIVRFDEEYMDPESGFPLVVWLDYGDLLVSTAELSERDIYTK